jgi:hypothetical protein
MNEVGCYIFHAQYIQSSMQLFSLLFLLHTQELTTSYAGAGNNTQIGTNDSIKKGLMKGSNP